MYKTILVALDGSADSLEAGRLAILAARNSGARILATHVYDLAIHEERFEQMEPGLPAAYQESERIEELREGHDKLMTVGFKALSSGYMTAYIERARQATVDVEELILEGRNYVRLLDAISEHDVGLVALGARGLGALDDGQVGSVALRVLRAAECDVLLARNIQAGPGAGTPRVLAGIDGSGSALGAMEAACEWSRWLETGLDLVAAFDPGLHQQVFRTMARAMPADTQAAVGLETQEKLHEALIDDGLATLYREFLDQAAAAASEKGCRPETHLVAAKAYRGLLDHAVGNPAGLMALGRFGHHREEISTLGSNTERVATLAECSVLVAAAESVQAPREEDPGLPWDPEAEERLERVPGFARGMARKAVEEQARARGEDRVTAVAFDLAASKMGMGKPG